MTHTDHLSASQVQSSDIVLVGSGIMSASVGVMLKCLQPNLRIQLYEVTDALTQESSHGWNNAGTGHAGLCELSYTPHRRPDGRVDIRKAIEIFEQFEASRQFWSFAVKHGIVTDPKQFIRPVPHMSFVWGEPQVQFLQGRFEEMSTHHFFTRMRYATDREVIRKWAPLLLQSRGDEPVAATRMRGGTDVNFGSLSRELIGWLGRQPDCGVATGHLVTDLVKGDGGWHVHVEDLANRKRRVTEASFVFIGAGGGSLPLLQRSGIAESRGIGGFPIGGQWLVCDNPAVVQQHRAKVYGQALGAAPTMAVPHLDTRVLEGKHVLLFGPFASWTTKFLHGKGSAFDLPRSVRPHNLGTLLKIGAKNLDLIRYLREQGMQTKSDKMAALREFYPAAVNEDWRLIDAGIRVQAIKKTDGQAGIVHYGTEIITSSDRSIAALLGASPGASVSASIALDVIRKCMSHLLEDDAGRSRMKAMIPTWDVDIKEAGNASFYEKVSRDATGSLQLESTTGHDTHCSRGRTCFLFSGLNGTP